MLILSRKIGESLMIGKDIEIVVTEVNGDKVRLGIIAPKNVEIYRKELYLTIESNRQAADKVDSNNLLEFINSLKHTD
ncbi:carbon storage regulator CsrA [Hydrogenoanaerobacterium saccharovorans]|uniref:Translational regulator CsrA n=1 Tax=Hydrogenoanaerobacterium saccharovorans TaxID=474960 RepID=A0A1H7ZU57_9FIRM|nr:carbon storage regulator CsrA [Hydrogenoanaerobacterium saccharovorans]RPF48376.1 carbon storage regulator CsrA [Hydrogenoanaerobacterium saccharovorans]SEM61965.1 carbon storage regulator, CsrA [Hydrogenoanaerobacterium saccharovorans]